MAVTFLAGDFPLERWGDAVALLRKFLPSGLPPDQVPSPPTTTADAVETIAHALCAWNGFPAARVRRTRAGANQIHCAALPVGYLGLPHAATAFAVRLLAAIVENADADAWVAAQRPALLALREEADNMLSGSRRYVVAAAERRGLPWRTLSGAGVIFQIGEGRRARLFEGSATWLTGAPGMHLAGNKQAANRVLHRAGVPVARQLPVPDLAAARAALPQLGLPMVIKPVGERRQAGVSFVYADDELEVAFAAALEVSPTLIAESYLAGNEYRALVIGGRVCAVMASTPATVVGDGRSTIEELVEAANGSGRRGSRDEGFTLSPILWNDLSRRFLAFHGHATTDVLPAGRRIEIYPLPIMRFGADPKVDVTDRVHPDNHAMLVRATAMLGLDVAGIDMRTPDIGRPWHEVGGGLCEVNPQPNLAVHYRVRPPVIHDVGEILLDSHMPRGERWLMTHVLLVGDRTLEPMARHIAAGLRAARGWRVATATPSGVDLEGWRPRDQPASLVERYAVIIEDRTLDAAVHVIAASEIARHGLGFRRLDVAFMEPPGPAPDRDTMAMIKSLHVAGATIARLPAEPDLALRATLALIGQRDAPPAG